MGRDKFYFVTMKPVNLTSTPFYLHKFDGFLPISGGNVLEVFRSAAHLIIRKNRRIGTTFGGVGSFNILGTALNIEVLIEIIRNIIVTVIFLHHHHIGGGKNV